MIEKMKPNLKWTAEMLANVSRDSDEWKEFVAWQMSRIQERLARYNNVAAVKTQIEERGEPNAYQNYKINVVSNFLNKALELMGLGKYGICVSCNEEIPVQRLLLVPGALRCMKCENKKLNILKPWDNT